MTDEFGTGDGRPDAPGPHGLRVVDAHAHFFSHGFFKGLLRQRAGGTEPDDDEVTRAVEALGLEAPPRDAAELARRWVGEMDRHGVERMVLMASIPPDWPSVARAVAAFPDRIAGTTMVDPLARDAVVERALGEGGLRGICLFPAMHRYRVHDRAARDVIEVAARRGALVFCHFGVLKIPIRGKLGLPSAFDGTFANPTDLHPVAADFPDVTFQVPHFGAGYFRETLLLGAQCPNVVVDTSSSNSWMTLVGHDLDLVTVLRRTLDVFGAERILWGSDASILPRGWRRDLFDMQVDAMRTAGCDDAAVRAILGGNARRILGE